MVLEVGGVYLSRYERIGAPRRRHWLLVQRRLILAPQDHLQVTTELLAARLVMDADDVQASA